MNILKIDYKSYLYYEDMYIIINNDLIVDFGYGGTIYNDSKCEEIDADLFIRTNGTCEETQKQSYRKTKILNQKKELNKLNLKLQKCISLEEHDLKIKTVLNEKHYLEKENKSLKESSKISCNMLHSQKDKIYRLELNYVSEQSNYKKEIDNLKTSHNQEVDTLKAKIKELESKEPKTIIKYVKR